MLLLSVRHYEVLRVVLGYSKHSGVAFIDWTVAIRDIATNIVFLEYLSLINYLEIYLFPESYRVVITIINDNDFVTTILIRHLNS